MIKSIKYFLLISLLVSITIASAINGIGNYLLDEKVVQPYLDSQLVRTSSLIEILYKYTDINPKARDEFINYLRKSSPITNLKLLFQVWGAGRQAAHEFFPRHYYSTKRCSTGV